MEISQQQRNQPLSSPRMQQDVQHALATMLPSPRGVMEMLDQQQPSPEPGKQALLEPYPVRHAHRHFTNQVPNRGAVAPPNTPLQQHGHSFLPQHQQQQLPLVPNLALPLNHDNQQQQQRPRAFSISQSPRDTDAASTVSSVSNTSWERYQKLMDRYGWTAPSPMPENTMQPRFCPPAFICFERKQEIPEWLQDVSTLHYHHQIHQRRKSSPDNNDNYTFQAIKAELFELSRQEEICNTPRGNNSNKAHYSPNNHGQSAVQSPANSQEVEQLFLSPSSKMVRGRRHINSWATDQAFVGFVDNATTTTTTPTTPSAAMRPPTVWDSTPIDDFGLREEDIVAGSDGNDQPLGNINIINNNKMTHSEAPSARLWDLCIKSSVKKVLGNSNHHRRCQSYDFHASPSGCLT